MVGRFLALVGWIGAHPDAFMLIIVLAYALAVLINAVILCRWERHESIKAEQARQDLRWSLMSPEAKATPKAPGFPSKRVG